jgi:hypothetical protein
MIALTLSNLNALSVTMRGVATNLDATLDSARPELQRALHNAADATTDVKQLVADLQQGKGIAGAALKDDTLRAQFGTMLTNLTTVSSNLARFGILYSPKQSRPLTNDTRYTGRGPFR